MDNFTLFKVSYISIYVKSKDHWSLTATGKYCSKTIVSSTRDSLADCKAYCMQNGVTRITYFQTKMCRCCTADSDLASAIPTAEIYEYGGSYVHIYKLVHTYFILFVSLFVFITSKYYYLQMHENM